MNLTGTFSNPCVVMALKGTRSISWTGILAFFVFWIHSANGDVSFSVPEEIKRGSIIGNIVKDIVLQ